MMLSPTEIREEPLVQATCIQKFDFGFKAPECGKPAAFLIKSIYEPEYSIMCRECKEDFFSNIGFQHVIDRYRAYFYSTELNEKFSKELKEYLANVKTDEHDDKDNLF